jgi:CRISPR-associated endonuclease/helicase Cas3
MIDLTTNPSFVFPYWGKTDKKRDGMHSHLLAHILPVGAVAQVLLSQPSVARVIGHAANMPGDGNRVLPLLVWVAMLHDLGKLLPEFQEKCDWVLRSIGLPCGPARTSSFSHGDQGYHQLAHRDGRGMNSAMTTECGWRPAQTSMFGDLLIGACAHHGHHVSVGCDGFSERDTKRHLQKAILLAGYTKRIVEDMLGPIFVPEVGSNKALVQVFSGVVALADWIGSDETTFQFVDITTFETIHMKDDHAIDLFYISCLARASQRVAEIGLDAVAAPGFNLLEATFGRDLSIDDLRPMQRAILETAKRDDVAMVIVEDSMGAGKTEAALLFAGESIRNGRAQGLVFSLPSRASADQTFSRLNTFSNTLFGTEPNLSHGSAAFSRDRLLAIQGVKNEQSTGNESAEHLSHWITSSSKRAFLAPVCAATVDQIMLAAMDCKHGFVRAACITRHVVVIDEVHAYDEYMGSILNSLLYLLGACGTPVALLSATLPKATRLRYLNAYRQGMGMSSIELAELGAPAVYPLLTTLSHHGEIDFPTLPPATEISFAMSPEQAAVLTYARKPRNIAINLRSEQEVMGRLVEAAKEGCAAIICNTVASAIARYETLCKRVEGSGIQVHLLHSRFRLRDRQTIGEKILWICGKSSTPESRRGHIVVATQVIEQSLDLDFDYMASELGPIDLLLQRLGRLFRHYRPQRPSTFQTPIFDILDPVSGESEAGWMRGTRMVYDNQSILDGTTAWLRQHDSVELPGGINDAVSAVYDRFAQNTAGHNKEVKGKGRAIDFSLTSGENIVRNTDKSSDTRGSDDSDPFLFVRVDVEGEPLDLLTGLPIPWISNDDGEISMAFLAYANESLVSLRVTVGEKKKQKKNPPGDDMARLGEKSRLNRILSEHTKYSPFTIVECSEKRQGELDVISIGMGHTYGKYTGFN